MVTVIDYGVGNLFSLMSSLSAIGEKAVLTRDGNEIRKADMVILPGVGAFSDAAEKLSQNGLSEAVVEFARSGRPLLGICLGMQLLFEESLEYGKCRGLSLINGRVVPLGGYIPNGMRIPHTGWNSLKLCSDNPLFKYITNGDHVYFVHSFFADDCDKNVIAYTEYGALITAAVAKDNIYGCQFHPEKSGNVGLSILRAFCENGRSL